MNTGFDFEETREMMSDEILIRKALETDLPGIVNLMADDALGANRERPDLPLPSEYLDAFAEMGRQSGNDLLVATLGNELVGCLQLTIIPGISRLGSKRAQIEGVRVSRHHRSQGVGEKLVRGAIDRARTRGCSLVQLTTDRSRSDAQRFYEKLGFAPSHIGMKLEL